MRLIKQIYVVQLLIPVSIGAIGATAAELPVAGLVQTEFIYTDAPFPECHASTLAETSSGLVVAWFGGTEEKNKDVGIWISRRITDGWTTPVEVVNGVQSAELRYPCWNPVLFTAPSGKLMLFYKVGPSPSTWWGMLIASDDGGQTWSEPRRLPEDILGPIKNKPVLLSDGRLLCGSSTEHDGWRVHMEWTPDWGDTWQRTPALANSSGSGIIQPTILSHGQGKLQILCRARRGRKILSATSEDAGRTWSDFTATTLPNPNSGIDGVTLRDGRHLLVYNHTPRGRSPLNVAVSENGKDWQAALVLENTSGEYSYPAVIQTNDGLVHATYTWKRKRVKHVVINPAELKLTDIVDGQWPQ